MSETPFMTADQLRETQAKEYGTYLAVGPIDINGARAFNAGDPVPVGHVESGVVGSSQVAKVGTKAADAVTDTPKG